jgi:hypothetical protein
MMIYRRLFTSISVIFLVLLCANLSYGQQWSGILNASRATNWSAAGVVGGIPSASWTQCVTSACQTVTTNGASSTAAQIAAAWTSAPPNTYVLLPAGTYHIAGLCLQGQNNVALRGAGANQTFIVSTGGTSCGASVSAGIQIVGAGSNSNFSPDNLTTVSGNLSQNSSTVTFAAVPNLRVGSYAILDQLDSTTDLGGILVLGTTNSYTGSFTAPGNAGPYTVEGSTNYGTRNNSCASTSPANCYHQQEHVTVTSCNGVTTASSACSGTNVSVGISPPLSMSNWSTGQNMSAWWATSPSNYVGVEDLSLDPTAVGGSQCANNTGVNFQNVNNGWVKGVAVIQGNQSHVNVYNSAHISIVNNYFFGTQYGNVCSYGTQSWGAGTTLVENNIFHGITSPMIRGGAQSDSVYGYNFTANNYLPAAPAYNQNGEGDHAAGSDLNLMEGNITNWATGDDIHGTGNLNTYFRNLFYGLQPVCYSSGSSYSTSTYTTCSNPASPIIITAYHRFYNTIGNVLQNTDASEVYGNSGSPSNTVSIIQTGVFNQGSVVDPNVYNTGMFWGNADNVTGYGSPRFNCSEVPAALTGVQAPYSNPCPSSHTLPASFYYSATPSWWPSGKAWPVSGPDVSGGNLLLCTGGTQTRALVTTATASACTSAGGTTSVAMGGLSNSNPAMDCYLALGGLPNGTGLQLTNFNESSCYAGTVSTNPPLPPTNVKATAQ